MCQKPLSPKPGVLSYPFTTPPHLPFRWIGANGARLWQYRTGAPVASTPAVVDGVLYVGSGDRHLYAINSVTGVVLWNLPTDGLVITSPAVADGLVYVGSADGTVYAAGVAEPIVDQLGPPQLPTATPVQTIAPPDPTSAPQSLTPTPTREPSVAPDPASGLQPGDSLWRYEIDGRWLTIADEPG